MRQRVKPGEACIAARKIQLGGSRVFPAIKYAESTLGFIAPLASSHLLVDFRDGDPNADRCNSGAHQRPHSVQRQKKRAVSVRVLSDLSGA